MYVRSRLLIWFVRMFYDVHLDRNEKENENYP